MRALLALFGVIWCGIWTAISWVESEDRAFSVSIWGFCTLMFSVLAYVCWSRM